MLQSTDDQGLLTYCWPQVHFFADWDDISSSQFRGGFVLSTSITPDVIGFLDRDYRFKSVATQIPHEAGFAAISYTGRKLFLHRRSNQHLIP